MIKRRRKSINILHPETGVRIHVDPRWYEAKTIAKHQEEFRAIFAQKAAELQRRIGATRTNLFTEAELVEHVRQIEVLTRASRHGLPELTQ